ncbi:addiction module protein [Humisphaera borealis]|jgi:putative addiction module component (TIGR02574 family)|uniref:Addiction module protein n=1 Tax=Humisphaera borealis TaxID=2807512 RepID=A0A7M2X354_9BACT|nr:addiction module protein [Humisphaera borealis]QOV92105.1 addiction module protein [Humisphaera borealis]
MPHSQLIDIAALTPVERMALADMLYDSAMQEIGKLPPEEMAEMDRRISRLVSGEDASYPWSDVHARHAGA